MARVDKYASRSKISEAKSRQLAKLFDIDEGASQIAQVTGLSRNTVSRFLMAIHQRIAEFIEQQVPVLGEIELHESYFDPRRLKGLRGHGASCKAKVFDIFKRQGRVYAEIVTDCTRATPQAVFRGLVSLDSVILSDGWRGYSGLVGLGCQKHFRVNHGKNEFANERSHINGIESFWGLRRPVWQVQKPQ